MRAELPSRAGPARLHGRLLTLALAALAAAVPLGSARAAPQRLEIGPPAAEIGMRAYALGMLPVDGTFTRFAGVVSYDTDQPGRCSVRLRIETASLSMPNQAIRDDVVSPAFLDAEAFPVLGYEGSCAPHAVRGSLTLHGQTHPLELALEEDAPRLVATGRIRRAEWGITGHSLSTGSTVRIRVTLPLTDSARRALPMLSPR